MAITSKFAQYVSQAQTGNALDGPWVVPSNMNALDGVYTTAPQANITNSTNTITASVAADTNVGASDTITLYGLTVTGVGGLTDATSHFTITVGGNSTPGVDINSADPLNPDAQSIDLLALLGATVCRTLIRSGFNITVSATTANDGDSTTTPLLDAIQFAGTYTPAAPSNPTTTTDNRPWTPLPTPSASQADQRPYPQP